jgi:predicted DCC family thiol-disulfide oxidoreductase YuxK
MMRRDDPDITRAVGGGPVMLFDGVCNLCNGWVHFAIARDPEARLRFAAVQSPLGQAFLARQGLPLDVYETFYFVEHGVVYEKSTAWLRMLRYLNWPWPWPWPWSRVFTVVPRWLRDPIYSLIARNRYRWFGRREVCMVPTPEITARFIG